MDQIFDRLGNLLKSVLQDDAPAKDRSTGRYGDKDMQDAWEELDNFLNEEEPSASRSGESGDSRQTGSRPSSTGMPDQLKTDYANLEVQAGAPMDEVKKSYKRLLIKYHPDRHAGNPERFETATRVTQKINESFQRIRKYTETGSV